MSKKANPTLIGLFILIGLALGVGGILLFSSAKFFAKTEKYILYFDASVRGLSPGAPVKFRGVTVGTVLETLIHHNQAADDTHMPVVIEIDENLVRKKTDRTINLSSERAIGDMITQGMRGILEAQSLITGVLYVELDILPGAPAPTLHQIEKEYKEIPTAPTKVQTLIDNLADIDFKKTMSQLNTLLTRLEGTLGDLHAGEISHGLTNLIASLNHFVQSPELTHSLTSLHTTLDEYRLLSEKMRAKIDPLTEQAGGTLKEAQTTLAELRRGLENISDLLAPQAVLRRDVATMMDELADAARSVRALVDFLNHNPNAILSGRKPETKP